jgi:flagellar hook-associated protein 2
MSSTSSLNSLLNSSTSSTSGVDLSSILAASVGATTPGIDVTAAVAAAIAADRAPETAWNNEVTTFASQTTALTAIQSATEAVATDMQSLNTLTGPLAARTVASSDSSSVSATAASGTVAGTHNVVVNNLATTGAWYSDLETSSTSTLPATSFTIKTVSGSTATITTGSGINTLSQLATAINSATGSDGKSLGLTATVVTDSTGSRLAIVSNSPGSAADFSITSTNYSGTSWKSPDIPTGATLGANSFTLTSGSTTTTINTTAGETYAQLATAINTLNIGVTATAGTDANGTSLSIASTDGTTPFTISEPSFGFSQAVAGENANITVDGVPVSSASNTVTGAIPGVTLSLLGQTTASGASLTVASDASQVSTAINQFVSDYNTAIGLVNAQFSYSSTSSSEGVLASDPTMRSLQSALMQALNFVSTPSAGNTATPTLASLGITAATDGTLSIDTSTFDAALTNNPTDVQNFFQGASLNGFASSLNTALNTFTDPGDGAFTVDLSSISTNSAAVTSQISDFETNYIANQQTLLTAEYSQAEIALQQLPTEMAQINTELGNNSNGNSNG